MKAKKLAEAWIREPEGQEIWKQECRRLLMECRSRLEVVPRAEIELRTWQALVVYRSKVLAKELGGQGKELGDAEDYLVRAWEILESNLGRASPDVGAACISLGNLAIIRHRPMEATDWFRRALRTFQDCFPEGYTPITASTAVTLGNLLAKQAAKTSQGGGRLEEPRPDGGVTSQEDRQGSVQPGRDPLQEAWRVGALSEATELLENAAKFYSGRVEEATLTFGHCGGGREDAHGVLGSPCGEDDAFAWSDPDVAGSRLDPQTADFARRAAELWTQAVGLRELCANRSGGGQGVRHVQDGVGDAENDAGALARVVEQAARATELARGPCSVALGRLCQKLGEARQEDGDFSGAKDAFCRARAVFTDRYGRNDPRAKQAAAAAAATTAAIATAAPRKAPPPTPAEGRAFNAARCR